MHILGTGGEKEHMPLSATRASSRLAFGSGQTEKTEWCIIIISEMFIWCVDTQPKN